MLCVNVELVPSVKFTTKLCDAWEPCTPVASSRTKENLPAGSVTVWPAQLTTSDALAAPRLNVVLFQVAGDVSRLAEYAAPPPSSPPVNVVPSLTRPLLRLKVSDTGAGDPPPC